MASIREKSWHAIELEKQRKEIYKRNPPEFLKDLSRARECLVWLSGTSCYINVKKIDVRFKATYCKVVYKMTNEFHRDNSFVMLLY